MILASDHLKATQLKILKRLLQELHFPNYETFDNMDTAYSDFMSKISKIIDDVAPIKRKRIKNNSQEWFDGEIAEKIAIRDKNLKKFKNPDFISIERFIKNRKK